MFSQQNQTKLTNQNPKNEKKKKKNLNFEPTKNLKM